MTRPTFPLAPWLLGVLGLAVAVAMVVGGFQLMTGTPSGPPSADDARRFRAGDASPSPTEEPQPSSTASATPADDRGGRSDGRSEGRSDGPPPRRDREPRPPEGRTTSAAVPAYFVGETPAGLRLYREFQRQTVCGRPACGLWASVRTAVQGSPLDPDYRSAWPRGTRLHSVRFAGDRITVDLSSPARRSLWHRPTRLSPAEAALALQQVVYSAQAGLGRGRPPVRFLVDGARVTQLLGRAISPSVSQGSPLETLSLMMISDPGEGTPVSDTLTVTGVNNGFEATVSVEIRDDERVVASAAGTAAGWMGDQLFPWAVSIDVSDLPAGTYTVVASNDDASGGAEGGAPFTDTRTVQVE